MHHDPRLFEARYDIATAARHLRMAPSTLSAWLHGAKGFKRVLDPPRAGYLSFVTLTEAYVLLALRRHYQLRMPNIRSAIDYVERKLGVEHPLAYQEFTTDSVDLFVETVMGTLNVSRGGQTKLDQVHGELMRIEWKNKRPIALFPLLRKWEPTQDRPIRISPLVAFGQPVLTGTRIPTSSIASRFYGGEGTEELAADYGVSVSAIEEAVRVERDAA